MNSDIKYSQGKSKQKPPAMSPQSIDLQSDSQQAHNTNAPSSIDVPAYQDPDLQHQSNISPTTEPHDANPSLVGHSQSVTNQSKVSKPSEPLTINLNSSSSDSGAHQESEYSGDNPSKSNAYPTNENQLPTDLSLVGPNPITTAQSQVSQSNLENEGQNLAVKF